MGNIKANVFDVAEYILSNCGEMTTMKLQKMVYYCQAWSLAWDEKPLFEEDFEAWAAGPVCKELYLAHRGKFVVSPKYFDEFKTVHSFTAEEIETMDTVIKSYCDKTAQWLSDLSHGQSPWKNARIGVPPGERSDHTIAKEDIQQYFSGLME